MSVFYFTKFAVYTRLQRFAQTILQFIQLQELLPSIFLTFHSDKSK